MVEAFVGLVGGGKSFNSVRRMMAYMARGGRVCSNILLSGYDEKTKDLRPDSPVRPFLRSIGWEYQPRQYVYISFEEMVSNPLWIKSVPAGIDRDHKTLLVVDEATDLFDSLDGGRLRADSAYREIFHFLRLSRHVHVDVLFIAQDIKAINTRLQGLVAYIWRSTDMRNFRMAKLRVPFPFDLFLLQQFDRSGKYETRREWIKKDKRVFTLYESEAFNQSLAIKWDGVAVSQDAGKIKKGKKKMNMIERVLLVVALVAGLWAVFRPPERVVVPVPSGVSTNAAPVSVASVVTDTNTWPRVDRDSFVYYPSVKGSRPYVVFGGRKIMEGMPCEFGYPDILTSERVEGRTFDGKSRFFLYPFYDNAPPSPVSSVSMKVVGGSEKGGLPPSRGSF